MTDYKKMYTIMVDVVEKVLDGVDRILDEVNGRVEPDDGYFLQLKEELTDALLGSPRETSEAFPVGRGGARERADAGAGASGA